MDKVELNPKVMAFKREILLVDAEQELKRSKRFRFWIAGLDWCLAVMYFVMSLSYIMHLRWGFATIWLVLSGVWAALALVNKRLQDAHVQFALKSLNSERRALGLEPVEK